jgi:hypothetical protein
MLGIVHRIYSPPTYHPASIQCSSNVHPMFIQCSSNVHPMFIQCSSNVHPMFPMPHPHNGALALTSSQCSSTHPRSQDRKTMSTTDKIAPHEHAMQLQNPVLYEISQLNLPRLPVMEMEVIKLCESNSFLTPPSYAKQDLCRLIHNYRYCDAIIYFSFKYTPDKPGRRALFDDLYCGLPYTGVIL